MTKNKIINLTTIILLLLIITSLILPTSLNDLDELWNFNFARNIALGNLPYQDFNMITTPLLPILISPFLNLFGTELFIFRILNIIFCTSIFYLIYHILRKLNIHYSLSLIIIFCLLSLFKGNLRLDYNFSITLLTLIIMYLELTGKKNKYSHFLIGLLAGTSILIKQTTGLVLSLTICIYPFFLTKNHHLSNTKKYFLPRIIGIIIPLFIFLIYLLSFNILDDFIDYSILGIKTFSNSINYLTFLKSSPLPIQVFAVILPLCLITQLISLIKNKLTDHNQIILFSLSVSSLVVIYPIADTVHFLIGNIPNIIATITLLYNYIKPHLPNSYKLAIKKGLSISWPLPISLLLITTMPSLITYINTYQTYTSLENFKYIPISSSLEQEIHTIDDYITSSPHNVYILDAASCVYTIPINKYDKDYDMFLIGNIGSKGEEGIIQNLKQSSNTTVLIRTNKEDRNWQTPTKVIDYIEKNWTLESTISSFTIYTKQ